MMAHMWSEGDKKVIDEYETFLKEETKRTGRLKDAGPTGEPWPKKPKICARDLDRINNPEQNKRKSLAGEELHKYLIENCAEAGFILVPPAAVHGRETLDEMTPRLIAGWGVAKQKGRTALCAYIDFGNLLHQAFSRYKIEKDCGERTDTWEKWLKQHLRISTTEAKKCREVAALLTHYPCFRNLSLTYTEVYNRRERIRNLLESPGPYAEYWRQS